MFKVKTADKSINPNISIDNNIDINERIKAINTVINDVHMTEKPKKDRGQFCIDRGQLEEQINR